MMRARIYDTTISVERQGEYSREIKCTKNYENFLDTMKFLGSIGFYVTHDKGIKKRFPILNDYHRYGRYKDLEFKAEVYNNGFKMEFFQNLIYENPNSGYFDFDKLSKMPYLTRLQYELTQKKLILFLEEKEFEVELKTEKKGTEYIVLDYIKSWHHPQNEWFDLKQINGSTCEYSYNNKDRDGKTLYNGDEKYFRDSSGYLCRGIVYHNINNMWWVLLPCETVRNVASFELFDLLDSDERRRKKEHRPPEDYVVRKKWLSKCSTKEILNELKRRKRLEGME